MARTLKRLTKEIKTIKLSSKMKLKSKKSTINSHTLTSKSSSKPAQFRMDGIMDPEGKYPNPFTGKPATEYYKTMALTTTATKPWTQYQPWKDAKQILQMIHDNQVILVIASTGVGKTVIFPKLLAHYFNYETPIITTMPRQKMLQESAIFAAKLMDVPLFEINPETGQDIYDADGKRIRTNQYYVGYRHGDEKTMSDKSTKLLFATDSLVKMLIQRDHLLSEYGGVIIDEAHERSIHIDILIKLVFDIIKERPNFKVIIMSATVNKDVFISYVKRLGMESKFAIYESIAPTQYKIGIERLRQPVNLKIVVQEMYNTIKKLLLDKNSRRGDILAFVSSESETNKLSNMINADYKSFHSDWKPYACAISSKSLEDDKAIAIEKNGLELATAETHRPYHVKVIVATNIAESGMTFNTPIVYVIESGMAYERSWDASNYVYSGGKTYITQANITQRCGRTGRTIAGDCIQMYTQLQYEKFAKYPAPSITKEDITGELLGILCLPQIGGSLHRAIVFLQNMIEPVLNYRDKLLVAIRNLIEMDLLIPSLEDPKSLAEMAYIGRTINKFGKFDIRSGRMILAAALMGIPEPAIMLAAILFVITRPDDLFFKRKDAPKSIEILLEKIKRRWTHPSGDHITLLNIFVHWLSSNQRGKFAYDNMINQRIMKRIEKSYVELVRMLNGINLDKINMPGIQKVKRPTIRLSASTKESIKRVEKMETEPEEPTMQETDVQDGGDFSNKSNQPQHREMPNLQKYISNLDLEKLLLALGYGYNTNLGYYNSKYGNYQIMHSKYMVDMSESVLAHSKSPPKYVIYYQAVHQEDKGNTDFQIVSSISENVLTKLVDLKKRRTIKNDAIDLNKIKLIIDGIYE